MVKFQRGNAKLGKRIYIFNLPAGYSCPAALNCLSKADRQTGKIKDGPHTQFRCYAASSEARFPSVRKSRWDNFDALKKLDASGMAKVLADAIQDQVPIGCEVIRIHSSGDFFNQSYLDAWIQVAQVYPAITFYAYTKALDYWINAPYIPNNLKLIASYGGRHDDLIDQNNLRYSKVVYSYDEAEKMGLRIDHDDSIAYGSDESFALLIHGSQPKGSQAGKAVAALRVLGFNGYSK